MTDDVGTATLVIRFKDDQIDVLDRPFFFLLLESECFEKKVFGNWIFFNG